MSTENNSIAIQVETVDSVSKKVTAVFEASAYQNAEAMVLKAAQSKAVLPGFRKGKVPTELLKQRYGQAMESELKEQLVKQALDYAVQKEKLSIAAITDVDYSDLSTKRAVSITVEIKPEVSLPDFKNFQLGKADVAVKDTEVTEFITRLRKQYATYHTVDRAIQKNDYVKLSYEGFVGEKPVGCFGDVSSVWSRQKSTWQAAGVVETDEIPEIANGVIGMKAGETKSISVIFPKDFELAELQKKEGVYHVTIEEVREVVLPEMDEKFFEKIKVKDLDALKSAAEQTLQQRKKAEYAAHQKQRIAEYLVQSIQCDLPHSWVKSQTDKILQEMVDVFASHGVKEQEMEEQKALLYEKAKEGAVSRIKLDLCFEKLSRDEHLVLEEQDLTPIVMQEARRLHISPQKLVQQANKDNRLRVDIQGKAFQAKLINWLFNKLSKEQKAA